MQLRSKSLPKRLLWRRSLIIIINVAIWKLVIL